jgi:hypothetical protein
MVERGVQLLHVYCEGDEGLDYFHLVVGSRAEMWKAEWCLRVEIIRGANHTFTLLWTQERLLDVLRRWAESTILN